MSMTMPDVRARGPLELSHSPQSFAAGPSILERVPWWEWVLIIGFSLVCLAVAGPHALARVDCRVEPVPLLFGAEIELSMTVNSGSRCTVAARPVDASVTDLAVEMQPVFGRLQPRGRTGVIYRASRPFRGTDAFSFVLTGSAGASAGTSVVRVRVTVK
jgi:hypothetical protein